MATTLCCRAFVSSTTVRRRSQLVGAFSTLSSPSSSSYIRTGCAQSLPFVRLLRSKFSSRSPDKTFRAVKMEANSDTVPSIVVYVTVPNREAGRKLAGSIVKEKLAACVNIVPGVESVYEWEGKINTDPEELLIIKTRQSLLPALTEHVKANHEYDVPEVIALPINGGSPQYLEWLKNSTRD
ncbi:Protein CutA [Hibiscus syriacus]|uniref:Protein CutA n=2 Tax=Hibiscus syriacus TaxID=106335 RepID=A0A6A2WKG0_HIBSY|nr:protein CutA, chloroplastic-like isoform X1 [Hibiscus syriacus]KAE8659251.1 Protein CutA [Hibiscus syriacus]